MDGLVKRTGGMNRLVIVALREWEWGVWDGRGITVV
jgi:hypothetical protein